MSRKGKLPIQLPNGVSAKIEEGFVVVKGPKGELKQELHELVNVEIKENEILVTVKNPEEKKDSSLWGLFRTLIENLVLGVSEGFEKKLEINGVGYRAAVSGKTLTLTVGFSHPVQFPIPEGITITVEGNVITVSGIDKQLVGEISAQIRKVKKPEPYKGKGIKYADEVIRKEGKSAAKGE